MVSEELVVVDKVSDEPVIVDEVSGWLRVYSDGSIDRSWSGPSEVKFMTESVAQHEEFIEGVAARDVITDSKSGHRVRIYLPQKTSEESDNIPVVLHFHGGGFCISQADWFMYYNTYTRLARSARVICISVYQRLAPEHRLPAACDDGYAALLWLQAIAKGELQDPWLEAHADFNRVFLIGDSSGGNIVHEVAARAGNEDLRPLRLAGAIPIHPGFTRSERSKSELELPESPFLTLNMVDKFMSLSLPIGCNKDHPISCPMGAMAPPIHKLNLPPYFLCIAEMDLIRDTEYEYYEAMKNGGKDVELFVNEGMGHSFYLNKIAIDTDPNTATQTERLILAIADFIHRH